MVEIELVEFQSNTPSISEVENKIDSKNLLTIKLKDFEKNTSGLISLKLKIPFFDSSNFSKKCTCPEKFYNTHEKPFKKPICTERKYEMTIEQLKVKIELLSSIKDDLSKQKKSLEEILFEERKYTENLEKKEKQLSHDFSESLKRSEERDFQFVEKLNFIINENTDLQNLNFKLSCEVQEKENIIFYLQENHKRLNLMNSDNHLNDYIEKLEKITDLYHNSEKERDLLQMKLKGSNENTEKLLKSTNSSSSHLENNNKLLLKDIKELQDELKFYKLQQSQVKIEEANFKETLENKEEKIKNLNKFIEEYQKQLSSSKNEIFELSKKTTTMQLEKERLELEIVELRYKSAQNTKLEKTKHDEIDLLIDKYFNDQSLENLFVKISNGLYICGSKKVNVSIKKGNLICRVGGGYMMIDEFIKQEQMGKTNGRCLSITSPVNSSRVAFSFPNKHNKTKSLVSYLVSPKEKNSAALSFDSKNRISIKNLSLL